MKKKLLVLAALVLSAVAFVSCTSKKSSVKNNSGAEKKIQIVATIFPAYDWTKNILGLNPSEATLAMLLGNGVDMHSFQPSVDDIVKISSADLFIYVGGESDKWVGGALKNAVNKNMKVINLLDVLKTSVKEEELVEGMQEEEHGHGDEDGHHHDDETEYDEHVWLSLKNVMKVCRAISSALQEIDMEHKDVYAAAADSYIEKLSALDADYENAVKTAKRSVVLFADRFPFRYLADDYGLEYYAAFAGCSAESEASFETVRFLARKVDALNLPYILTIEGNAGGASNKLAETVLSSTENKSAEIAAMDSMQATSFDDVKNGASYIGIMEKNLSVLKEALN